MSNYKICYKKIITKNNLFGVNFIHTSGVFYSNVTVERAKINKIINEALAPENEVNNDLDGGLMKCKSNVRQSM